METYFVVRDTFSPELDLKRNWSAFSSGSINGESFGKTKQESINNYISHNGCEPENEYKYHNGLDAFVACHYEGLGAFELSASNMEDALIEASSYEDGLAVTMSKGNGHFFAEDVIRYAEVRVGRFVFEIKA